MPAPKHADIQAAITARRPWEDRQATWYQMRHDGLRRMNKPWPNAADMHFALADDLIDKLKPTFISQVYATDTIATLTALQAEFAPFQSGGAQWFDHQLKQESNFEEEIEIAIDIMLERGIAPVKVFWDADADRLAFEAINPTHLIVPPWTGKLAAADWIVHVQHYSRAAYEALPSGPHGFKQGPGIIARICGSEAEDNQSAYETQRLKREGINASANKDQIVIWELFYRDGRTWRVRTYSPNAPDLELRPEFGLPYNQGIFAEEGTSPPAPFSELRMEVKDRGFYSPRGVCERVAAEEASLCKDWNTLKDYQTLVCQPMFTAEGGVPTGFNLRQIPGQILPFKLAAVQFPPIPMDLAMQMQATQRLAQERIGAPSVGVGRTVDPSKNKTAAETNLISSIMSQGGDVRARGFRRQEGAILNLAWSILIQYRAEELDFYFNNELQRLDAQALRGKYRVEPSGSGDNNNRALVLQRAISRKQMFTGNPNVDQKKLDKSVLEADDPRLVKELLLNEGTQQAEQLEDQAQEISIMLLGFPAQVRPSDDDMSHLQSLVGFVQRRASLGEMLTAENLTALAQHAEQHLQAMKKKNPGAYAQNGQKFTGWIRTVQQQAQAMQQQQQAMQQQQAPVVPMEAAQL